MSSLQQHPFSRQHRLLNAKDFNRVFEQPLKFHCGSMIILTRTHQQLIPRIGVVLSKKKIPKAVDRNRIRRQIRESFRLHQDKLQGLDIVVLPKYSIANIANDKLRRSLSKIWLELAHTYKKASSLP